jgi:hypothetical protein
MHRRDESYRNLIEKPERKRTLERFGGRWDNNIRMNLKGIGCEIMDWINLGQIRVQWQAFVERAMNRRVP